MSPRLRRWLVPGLPFLVSLCLSAATVGNTVFWQDSGFYLVAVKEFDILYPPGFVLYLVLCKAWTLLLFLVDFTLAVHLFSALFAALAAATLAVAARDLLHARGPLFKAIEEDPGEVADWAAAAAGCIAAAGYTFWFTGIYAKGYSLYYFILAQLLWRMIRAHETGSGREFTWVAALIGLSWAAHPSAALLGPVFLAYVVGHRKTVGGRGLAGRAGLSALCALGPTLLIPFLSSRDSLTALGNTGNMREFLSFILGTGYTTKPGAFGWESSRAASFGQYLWEELLGIGLAGVTVGLLAVARFNRRLLLALLLWLVPFVTVTVLFKVEGQQDCWFVAGWMPLYLILAVGFRAVACRIGAKGRWAIAGLVAASVAWATAVNVPLLEQRSYRLPEMYGHIHLDALDRDAVLVISGDDPGAICTYLQKVKRFRPDVILVIGERLGAPGGGGTSWYLDRLIRAYPFFKRPDLAESARRFGNTADIRDAVALFLNENVACGRPIFSSVTPAARSLREEVSIVPAGVMWKIVRKGEEKTDLRYWDFPITPEEVRLLSRRERGQTVQYMTDDMKVKPEGYEHRLFKLLMNARIILAQGHLKAGNFAQAARLFEGILVTDPSTRDEAKILFSLAHAYFGLGDVVRAQHAFEGVLQRTSEPNLCAGSLLLLGKIFQQRGKAAEARRCWETGLRIDGVESPLRMEIEKALQNP